MSKLNLISQTALERLFKDTSSFHSTLWMKHLDNYHTNNYFVFDKETKLLKPEQNIYSDVPEFVTGSYAYGDSPVVNHQDEGTYKHLMYSATATGRTLVGHNICFDLNPSPWMNAPLIWDTALAHYMMTGQLASFPTLDSLAKYYGIPGKDETVSEMIKQGICPSVIPLDQLTAYCDQDVYTTRLVFQRQMATIESWRNKNLAHLMCQMMQWLWWTHTASTTGITVDRLELLDIVPTFNTQLGSIAVDVTEYMLDRIKHGAGFHKNWNPKTEISVTSPKQISTMIFGGDIDGYVLVDTGSTYKTGAKAGQSHYRKEGISITLPGIPGSHRFKRGTDEKNLLAIRHGLPMSKADSDYIDNVLKYRDLSKTVNTYLQSYLDKSSLTGLIHPQYKHVGTPTGRLSCTGPNIQNLKGE